MTSGAGFPVPDFFMRYEFKVYNSMFKFIANKINFYRNLVLFKFVIAKINQTALI
jgi:hypothetical protein